MRSLTSVRHSSNPCIPRTCRATWVSSLPTGSSTTSSPTTREVRDGRPGGGGPGAPRSPPLSLPSWCRHHHGARLPHTGTEGRPLRGPRLGTAGSLGSGQLPPLLPALQPRAMYVWLPCGQVCRSGAQGCPQGNDQNVCGPVPSCPLPAWACRLGPPEPALDCAWPASLPHCPGGSPSSPLPPRGPLGALLLCSGHLFPGPVSRCLSWPQQPQGLSPPGLSAPPGELACFGQALSRETASGHLCPHFRTE